MRTAKHSDLEAALLMWYKNARNLNIQISGTILQMKAANLAQGLGLDFHSSEDWLSRFKQRHDIQFRVISGESGDVTIEQTDDWSTTALPKIADRLSSEGYL